ASGDAHARILSLELMTGGAIQQNWAIEAELNSGVHQWVMRMDAPARVAESLTRIEEFRVLQVMHQANVLAPRPLWSCDDPHVMGRPFFIMKRLPGVAAGHRLTRDASLIPDRARLAGELARNLARIQSIAVPHPDLNFLKTTLARDNIARYRACLDALAEPYPVLEWGLRWCETHAPQNEAVTFIHRDYRTGNYLVADGKLSGVLDWEFAAFGNPLEDVGWIFAKCWRFGANEYPVGGVANAEDFLREYEAASGRRVDAAALIYWQVMAHLRWAVIALQQRERHRSGIEPSLELALTGHLISDFELEILTLTTQDAA
ncbi:MAG TPA: phosphotransferase family protein, partial [Burkholderiales bacterium]|nr:phosphotransferase family protein [Burkholderiales bacterium]